jgi:D-glycero-alpha-D-manno-heptose-7-phosphate kinase
MIIVRSPLRISLGGGGTDLHSYYEKRGGFVVAAAINKYVYVTLHETFEQELIVKYSQMERVNSPDELRHPIIRESLKLLGFSELNLEIASMADIPAGTGLGSSGSFTTALLKALHTYRRSFVHPRDLAEQACRIEIDILGEPIGKQDQYIASFGGLTCFEFQNDGFVKIEPLKIPPETLHILEDNLTLFFTGYSRAASTILKDQDERSKTAEEAMFENLDRIKEIGYKTCKALEQGDADAFGRLMHEHWLLKRQRSKSISTDIIDQWYELGMNNGALGGKLIGAGGGGFLLFYTLDKSELRQAMKRANLTEVRFGFDFEGTKVIV